MLTKKIAFVAVVLFVFSPWVLRGGGDIYSGTILQFLSFKLLFFDASLFSNIGKETGIVYPSLLPFFSYGLYRLIKSGKIISLFAAMGLLIISSVSAGWLIKLELFAVVALISYITALGIISSKRQKPWALRVLWWLGVFAVLYEIGQYMHYVQLHITRDLPTLGTN